MELTLAKLKELKACKSGIKLYKSFGTTDLKELFELAYAKEEFYEIEWVLTRLLNSDQLIKWALFAAKSVLPYFENIFPEDGRPRRTLEAAEAYFINPTEENRLVCGAQYNDACVAADYVYSVVAIEWVYTTCIAAVKVVHVVTQDLTLKQLSHDVHHIIYYVLRYAGGDRRSIYKYAIQLLTGDEK